MSDQWFDILFAVVVVGCFCGFLLFGLGVVWVIRMRKVIWNKLVRWYDMGISLVVIVWDVAKYFVLGRNHRDV